jgi:chitinase
MPVGSPYTGVGSGSWENGIWDYKVLPKAGATEYYDAGVGASYSYDAVAREFISYDTVGSVQKKSAYVVGKGLGGAMFWYVHDHLLPIYDWSLIKLGRRAQIRWDLGA